MTRPSTAPTKPAPAARRQADPEAWRIALELADGDRRRLEVLEGGRIVLVRNEPR